MHEKLQQAEKLNTHAPVDTIVTGNAKFICTVLYDNSTLWLKIMHDFQDVPKSQKQEHVMRTLCIIVLHLL